mgnify:CR=1 FL=1
MASNTEMPKKKAKTRAQIQKDYSGSRPVFSELNFKSIYFDIEQKILEFWKKNKIFEKSVEQRDEKNAYVFYDGPPFVTGTPHYGHLLGSILKDIIPRYQTMLGKRVERVWGWDCHGLPIEERVERKLESKNRKDIEQKIGIKKFIEECRNYVEETSDAWPWYMDRIARWVDMDNAYRTMDKNYMESVIWVFKELYDKGLIYKGKRVSLYCTRCGTPISNFEIAMDNSYKDVEDPSIYPKFKVKYTKTGLGCGIVAENEKDEILLMMRNEPGRDKLWGIFGGKMDKEDKDIFESARREAKEELNIELENLEYFGYNIDIFEGRMFKTAALKAKIKGTPQLTDENIGTELKWFAKEDIPWEKLHIPTRNALKLVLNGKSTKGSFTQDKPDVYVVAWTTTPWTLPQNAALVVDETKKYVTVKTTNGENRAEYLVLAEERVESTLKGFDYSVVDTYLGRELLGLSYEPLYTYFKSNENDYKIYNAAFVSMNEGSGVVHTAPGYGEDDTELGKMNGLSMFEGVDDQGKMLSNIEKFAGLYIKEADNEIIADLTKRNQMLKTERIVHSYPMCHRCATPLIYKSQDSWYINVQKLKKDLFANNRDINWIPEHIKHGRFEDGLKSAPDWGISRTRYWATPLPVWKCENCGELKIVGSIAEIEELSGKKVEDLHRPYIDEHIFECKKCKSKMYREPEVLDCWMESGSMPYAQVHYPFENEAKFKATFPGDFIVEYIAQTRAWFYVMHVLSTALYNKKSFKNVICTGVLLGNDGRKMSKSYGNYPDPKGTIEKYGGDALRLYLSGSVLSLGENANVSEEEISQKVKDILLPFFNTLKYFTIYGNLANFVYNSTFAPKNVLDRWILLRVQESVNSIRKSMDKYLVPVAVREIKPLLDDISTWYIRRSRDRFANKDNDALQTLYRVLLTITKTFAPFIPFATEQAYQILKVALKKGMRESTAVLGSTESRSAETNWAESVHLLDFPKVAEFTKEDKQLLESMALVRGLSSLAQSVRVQNDIPLKQPLSELLIRVKSKQVSNFSDELLTLVKDELNVEKIEIVQNSDKRFRKIGTYANAENESFTVALNLEITEELEAKRILREIIRSIQAERQKKGLKLGEKAEAKLTVDPKVKGYLIKSTLETIEKTTQTVINLVEVNDLRNQFRVEM